MSVRAAVLKAPGTNCDQETLYAFEQAGAQSDLIWVHQLKANPEVLDGYQLLGLPGGFSYGDDLGAGRLVANELTQVLTDALQRFLSQNKLIIGICNGFQILVKSGLLPAADPTQEQSVTLTWNDSGKFEDRWVHLQSGSSNCVWTQNLDEAFELPVAHGEGKFVTGTDVTLEQLLQNNQVALRYVDAEGQRAAYPYNPNGSTDDIAGICDPSGRVFGLMPHPERHLVATQHPRWGQESLQGAGAGLTIFKNGVQWAEANL